MRNASFLYTEQQVRDGTKDVTRRLDWLWARAGMRLMACRKVQWRRKGEPLVMIREIEIVSVRREPLNKITQDDCRREGFPELSPAEFVKMFCSHMKCKPDRVVTRVEFRYVANDQQAFAE